jgi:hypothetical protein
VPGAVQAARKRIGRNDFRYGDVTIERVGRRVTFLSLWFFYLTSRTPIMP